MPESEQVHDYPRDSGATGGPATGGGVEFQVNLAVDLALDFISQLLTETPTQRPMIVIEPRLVTPGAVTRWDISAVPANLVYEGKSNPSRVDIESWIDSVIAGVQQTAAMTFTLAAGQVSNGYAIALQKLLRLIDEEPNDSARFQHLCQVERDQAFDQLLARFGGNAFSIAHRLRLEVIPEEVLKRQIRFKLRFLVPAGQAEIVQNHLATSFLRGMKKREVFFILQLMRELEAAGVVFHKPEAVLPADLDGPTGQTVALLQRCPDGLPAEVICNVCAGGDSARLQSILFAAPDALIEQDGIWRCSPLPAKVTCANLAALLGEALRGVIAYIKANRGSRAGLDQIANAMILAEACRSENPLAAAQLFAPIDKVLKRLGSKREVLRAAQLTVDAARAVTNPDRAVREAEAKALICGHAWVYQRSGQLAKAEAHARESLELGESIGWKRNTAFCQKCMGRLKRVQADQIPDGRKRPPLLNESLSLLKQAVETFSACEEFGPNHEEVGDCYSLLGRTCLALRSFREAEGCAAKARELIPQGDSKDYMDLLILEGDLAAVRLDYSTADAKFSEAIGLLTPEDAEKSEIAARAHLARGVNLKKWRSDTKRAVESALAAATIWEKLGEHHWLGVAEWTALELGGDLSKQVHSKLKGLEPAVRVEAVRLWQQSTDRQHARTVAQRSELTDDGWARLISQARENDAIRHRQKW